MTLTGMTATPEGESTNIEASPHETYRFPFAVPLVGCDGTPLAPGRYLLRAGLGIDSRDGPLAWLAPGVAIAVVA